VDAPEKISMNPKEQLEKHRITCGPATISVESTCRRRLRDHFDSLLDRLTREIHPEGVDPEVLAMDEQVEIPEPKEPEETDKEKKERMIEEGKLKVDVKKEIQKLGILANSISSANWIIVNSHHNLGRILIFNHRPAKWIFNSISDIKILVSNSLYPSTSLITREWFESHPCVIYLGDIKPSESRNQKIVEL
jgi:hypothetical protein